MQEENFFIPDHIRDDVEHYAIPTDQQQREQYSDEALMKFNDLKNYYNPPGFTIADAYREGFLGNKIPLRNFKFQIDTGKPEQIFEVDPNDPQWYERVCVDIANTINTKHIDLMGVDNIPFDRFPKGNNIDQGLHKLYSTYPKQISFKINTGKQPRKLKNANEFTTSERDKHNRVLSEYINNVIEHISSKISTDGEWQKYSDYNNVVPLIASTIASPTFYKHIGQDYESFFRNMGVQHIGTMVDVLSRKVANCVKNVSTNINCHYKHTKKRNCNKKWIKRRCKKALTMMGILKWFRNIRDKFWGCIRSKSSCYTNKQEIYKHQCTDSSSNDDMYNDSDTDSIGSDSDSDNENDSEYFKKLCLASRSGGYLGDPIYDTKTTSNSTIEEYNNDNEDDYYDDNDDDEYVDEDNILVDEDGNEFIVEEDDSIGSSIESNIGLPYNPIRDKRISHIRLLTFLRNWRKIEKSGDSCPKVIKGKGLNNQQIECISRWLKQYRFVPLYYKPLDDKCLKVKQVSDHIFYDKEGVYLKYDKVGARSGIPYMAINEISTSVGVDNAGILGVALIGAYGNDLGNPCLEEKCPEKKIPTDKCERLLWEAKQVKDSELPGPFSDMDRTSNMNEQLYENTWRDGAISKGPAQYERDENKPPTHVIIDCVDKKKPEELGDSCPINQGKMKLPFQDLFDNKDYGQEFRGPADWENFSTKKFYTYWHNHKDDIHKYFNGDHEFLLFAPDDKIIGSVLSDNPSSKDFQKFIQDHAVKFDGYENQIVTSLSGNHKYSMHIDDNDDIKIQNNSTGEMNHVTDFNNIDSLYILPVGITSKQSNK